MVLRGCFQRYSAGNSAQTFKDYCPDLMSQPRLPFRKFIALLPLPGMLASILIGGKAACKALY
jgi:hypothetical protein